MKADILRRAELMWDEEDEVEDDSFNEMSSLSKGKKKHESFNDEVFSLEDDDDLDLGVRLRVGGDGEDSNESDEDGEGDDEQTQSPETIIELAYLRDPKVFERDATTRRSKARADLKAQTGKRRYCKNFGAPDDTSVSGWADEQIEGWKVMLHRTVSYSFTLLRSALYSFCLSKPGSKEKLQEKHAFMGNEKGLEVHPGNEGRSRGRGRGTSRGGRGRGTGRGSGGREGSDARERAWKDRNKAGRANHNRKRGHDKKMARAGPAPSM